MSTTSQQTPPAPALTDTELTHLSTALTGYATSAHPAYRAAAARAALDALASIKAHIWESAAAHLERAQHLEAAALLWSAQPYYAPRHTPATLGQVRAALAQGQPEAAQPAATSFEACPVCADLLAEDSPGPFCSIFCQQQHGDTRA
ncbi:hypothetical protein [Rothia nasimurium]|uniref:hypothetical protein n=1 Tax=Rothia nasimurium TaxID=85336 RepID=UPI001F3002E2|nr:hypothetical protein [Rothia nasimurium]